MRKIRVLAGLGITAVGLSLAGCGGHSKTAASTTSTFNDENNRTVKCMVHQTAAPVAIDRPGSSADPSSVFAYLRYYTANGNKPYCDGKPATTIDHQWLTLYVAGGAKRSNISRALSGT